MRPHSDARRVGFVGAGVLAGSPLSAGSHKKDHSSRLLHGLPRKAKRCSQRLYGMNLVNAKPLICGKSNRFPFWAQRIFACSRRVILLTIAGRSFGRRVALPRKLHVESPRATCHIANLGEQSEEIFTDNQERDGFLFRLIVACRKA